MKLVKQLNSTTCGQACVAMVLGITIEEAIDRIGHTGITSDEEICRVLSLHPEEYIILSDENITKLNNMQCKLVKHRDPKNHKNEHWTVYDGKYIHDPACFSHERRWPVYKYWMLNV